MAPHDYRPISLPIAPTRTAFAGVPQQPGLLLLAKPSPRLPTRAAAVRVATASCVLVHVLAAVALMIGTARLSGPDAVDVNAQRQALQLPRIVFLKTPGAGGGGGGGGARQTSPPSRARAPGRDRVTVPATVAVATRPADEQAIPPSLLLDAKPLASGVIAIAGLPEAPASLSISQGSGLGSGAGDGRGSGIGSGTGPGVGAGSGGGFGGGVYRGGIGLIPPSLVTQINPRYTPDALQRKVQGTVILEAIVRHDGTPVSIRVIRSLDAGLDQEAVLAARNWRFLPGRMNGLAVDVLVTIEIDFHIV